MIILEDGGNSKGGSILEDGAILREGGVYIKGPKVGTIINVL